MIEALERYLAPLRRRIQMMAGLVEVRLVDDGPGLPRVQVLGLDGETLDGVEHVLPYGLSARPKPGAEGVHLSLQGVRGEGVLVTIGDRRFRLKPLAEGEVALHDDQGQAVHLKRDGIEIRTPLKVVIQAEGEVKVVAASVLVQSDDVQLGGPGGAAVARVGDSVAGGVITAGSSTVRAA